MAQHLALVPTFPPAYDDPDAEARARIEHTIREALSAVACSVGDDLVIALALKEADYEQLPIEGVDLGCFLFGPLQASVESVFGSEIATSVLQELELTLGVLIREASGNRRRSGFQINARNDRVIPAGPPSEAPPALVHDPASGTGLATIPPAAAADARVSILTNDPVAFGTFDAALGQSAEVTVTSAAEALRSSITDNHVQVVVVDARNQVDVALLGYIAGALDERSKVIVWGAFAEIEAVLSSLSGSKVSWIPCGTEACSSDVALLACSALVAQ